MIDPVAEPGQAAHASSPPFDATNGMEPDDARCVGACSNVLRDEREIIDCDGADQMAHVAHHRQTSHLSVTHPAKGLMRRLVDALHVRIPVPVVPVRSWPKWSRRIPTRIAHGIGHGHARVFMESLWQQGGYPKLAASAPNSTELLHRQRAGPRVHAAPPRLLMLGLVVIMVAEDQEPLARAFGQVEHQAVMGDSRRP